MTPKKKQEIQDKARAMRRHIVNMIGCEGKVGHLGGSSSVADIVAALYFYKMNVNPADPYAADRDRFLLSKGHAVLAQYAALAESGFFPKDELLEVKNCGSMLQGHPDMTKTPGIEANTGSLGMGLSIGLGMALGLKQDKINRKVYVIIGDGELMEGQIWEAAMTAVHYKSDNLVAIIDKNRLQATGSIEERMDSGNLVQKFEVFGWYVIEINGHDMTEICSALDTADKIKGKPIAIVANTVKGKYVSFAENNVAFHNGALTPEQFEQAHKDIDSYICQGGR
ncbi:MAG: transketolase [Bacillota bacterium]